MRVRRVTVNRTNSGSSTATSYVAKVSLPCEPWEASYEQEIEAVTDRLICVATRLKELRRAVEDAEWEGKEILPFLQSELKYYQTLTNDGVRYEPVF